MWYDLKAPLSSNSSANGDDVWLVKQALKRIGYYEEPKFGITPYPDNKLFDAIKKFQADNELKVDGSMRPGGETAGLLFDLPGAKSPVSRCTNCGAWHGGVFSPKICSDCWGKGFR